MKKLNRFLIFFILLFSLAFSQAKAVDGDVNIGVNVLERKSTDTINDFVQISQFESPAPLKEVKGISTVNPDYVIQTGSQGLKNTKTLNPYLLALSPVYAVYYLVTVFVN